jgi:hypothetical protein
MPDVCEYPGCTRPPYTEPGVFSSPAYCGFHLYTLDDE